MFWIEKKYSLSKFICKINGFVCVIEFILLEISQVYVDINAIFINIITLCIPQLFTWIFWIINFFEKVIFLEDSKNMTILLILNSKEF